VRCLTGAMILVGSATFSAGFATSAFLTAVRLLINDFFWTDMLISFFIDLLSAEPH
jgi:hypothetical protein